MSDWLGLPRQRVLADFAVLTAEQVAYVLQLEIVKGARKGCPDARQVHELVTAGRLLPIDCTLPVRKWRWSSARVSAYIDSTIRAAGAPLAVA